MEHYLRNQQPDFLIFDFEENYIIFCEKFVFLYVLLDNFLKNQKLKNPAADCVDNSLLTLCAEKNGNP